MSQTFVFIGDEAVSGPLAQSLVKAGYKQVDSLSSADIILTFCDTLSDLEDVYFDTEGIIQSAKKGSYVIDLSSATPGFARELNAVATVSEIHALEAPLVVKDITLENAFGDKDNMFCYVAGEEDDYHVVKDVIGEIVGNQHYLGAVGTAQLAKAMSTLQSASILVSLIEADALYRAIGLPQAENAEKAFETHLHSARAKQLFKAITTQSFAGSFTVRMCTAELTAALMAADDAELILPSAEACMHLLELLIVIGGADKTPPILSLIYGDEANCAKYGLDWARAEQAYGQDQLEQYVDDDYEDSSEGFSGGFGGYSSN